MHVQAPSFLLGVAVMLAVMGCGTDSGASDVGVVTEILTAETPVPVVQSITVTPTVLATPTEIGLTRLRIWWPEPLASLDNSDAADVLSEQISAFQAAQGNVEIELRLKRADALGGIMSALRSASPVAPGALPDLTLVRRADLLAAAQDGLIYPLEGEISSAVVGDLFESALKLGQIDGELYGLPYTLEVQITAYRPDVAPVGSYADILSNNLSFVFPVAQGEQINSVLLSQYRADGGTLGTIDETALLTTLTFYEDAVRGGVIDPVVLTYSSPADYLDDLLVGRVDAGVVNSTAYLKLLAADENLGFGPIPTHSGRLVTEVNGWMWVVTTSSVERQALAARFLNWMLNASRQGEYTQAIHMLPSQRSSMQLWAASPYIDFTRELLANATLPISNTDGGLIARAVQSALIAVLSDESTAAEATADLINQLNG